MACETATFSPLPAVSPPISTSMSGAGQAAGAATASPVIEPQWPAVSTQLGAISVPVHRNEAPKVIRATDGYAPAAVLWPPTMAEAGEAPVRSSAPATTAARSVERMWVIYDHQRRRRRLLAVLLGPDHNMARQRSDSVSPR